MYIIPPDQMSEYLNYTHTMYYDGLSYPFEVLFQQHPNADVNGFVKRHEYRN